MSSSSFDVHQDTEECEFVEHSVVVKLTADVMCEPPSQMRVLGAARPFSYGAEAGAAGTFQARLHHASVPPATDREHLKIAFFFRSATPAAPVALGLAPVAPAPAAAAQKVASDRPSQSIASDDVTATPAVTDGHIYSAASIESEPSQEWPEYCTDAWSGNEWTSWGAYVIARSGATPTCQTLGEYGARVVSLVAMSSGEDHDVLERAITVTLAELHRLFARDGLFQRDDPRLERWLREELAAVPAPATTVAPAPVACTSRKARMLAECRVLMNNYQRSPVAEPVAPIPPEM